MVVGNDLARERHVVTGAGSAWSLGQGHREGTRSAAGRAAPRATRSLTRAHLRCPTQTARPQMQTLQLRTDPRLCADAHAGTGPRTQPLPHTPDTLKPSSHPDTSHSGPRSHSRRHLGVAHSSGTPSAALQAGRDTDGTCRSSLHTIACVRICMLIYMLAHLHAHLCTHPSFACLSCAHICTLISTFVCVLTCHHPLLS